MNPLPLLALLLAPQEAKVTYKDHVLPVFQNHCLACHDSEKKKGDLDLSTYNAALAGSSAGDIATAGDGAGSSLYKSVAHLGESKMPPKKPKIPEAEIAIIKKWIDGGLLETTASAARKTRKPAVDLTAAPAAARVKPEGPPALPVGLLREPVKRTKRPEALTGLASSPWAPLAAVAGPYQVLIYDSATLELAGLLPFPERRARVLKFSRDGAWLLAGGGQEGKRGRVVLWDVKSGDRVLETGEEIDVVLAADVSSDRRFVALGGPQKLVKILEAKDGDVLHTIKKHTDWVNTLEFSPDAAFLASGDRSGGLHVWEAPTGRILFTLNGHKGAITDLSWRADSRILASASEDGQVMLWEMAGGTRVKAWAGHAGGVASVDVAADGRLVTCGRDKLVRTWSPEGAKLKDFEAFDDLALQAVFSFDGARVIAGDWTGAVRVWNAADALRIGQLTTNPPTLEERIAADGQALIEARKAVEPAAAAVAPAEAASGKSLEALKAAETRSAQTTEASAATTLKLKAAEAMLAEPKKAVTAAQADLTARQSDAAAKALAAQGAAGLAQKARDEFKKLQEAVLELTKDPAKAKELEAAQKAAGEKTEEAARAAESAQKLKTEADLAANAQEPARKALADAQARDKQATEALQAAQAAVAAAKQTQEAAAADIAKVKKAAETSAAGLQKARAAQTEAQARVADLERRLQLWKAEQFNVGVHARKAEYAKVQAEHDALIARAADAREDAKEAQEQAQAARNAIGTAEGRVKASETALLEIRKGPGLAERARDEAQKRQGEKQVLASRAASFAAPLDEAAKLDPANVTLAQAAARAREAVDLLRKDAVDAQAAVDQQLKLVAAAREKVTAAEKALADARAALEASKVKATELAAAAKTAEGKIAPEQAKADAFKPKRDAAKAEWERLRQEYLARLPK